MAKQKLKDQQAALAVAKFERNAQKMEQDAMEEGMKAYGEKQEKRMEEEETLMKAMHNDYAKLDDMRMKWEGLNDDYNYL